MAIGGGPELPPQALDLERQTRGSAPMRRGTRAVLLLAVAIMAVIVVAGLVWIFVAE